MNIRLTVIAVTILSCLVISYVLYSNFGAEWLFWFFLYSVFAQMCVIIVIFTLGAFLTRRSSAKGPALMKGAGISALIIVIYWVVAIATMSILKPTS